LKYFLSFENKEKKKGKIDVSMVGATIGRPPKKTKHTADVQCTPLP
jgi:hypothetical protein